MRSSSGDNEWTKFDQLPADVMLRINGYCDQFASLWRDRGAASLEQFIDQLPSDDRVVALCELVDIDLHFRAAVGQLESSQWYLARWPELDPLWLAERVAHHTPGDATLTDPPQDASQLSLTQVGDYVIDGPLGTGGMGRIFRARHRLMGRQVALKVLKESHCQDASSRRRFEREVQLLAKLSHPNIVTAFDARQEHGRLVLVTELVEGEDLAQRVKRLGASSPLQAMKFARQAACGLHYAHQQNIIHRDIKPSNLLLSHNQTIKVLDLGLARWGETLPESQLEAGALTGAEQVIGTPQYMAPEQARTPLLADHRADIYSLGCTLYYLLTAAPPYKGQSSIDAIVAHWEQPTPRLPSSVHGERVVDGLADLVQSMMAKQMEERIQSMGDVLAELDHLILRAELETPATTPASIEQRAIGPTAFDETLVATADELTASGTRSQPPAADIQAPPFFQRWNRRLTQRMRWQVGSAIALVLTMLLSLFYWSDSWRTAPRELATLPAGVVFDGQADYISVDDFAPRVDRPVRIEVAVAANAQPNAANLVSWTGDPSLFLFIWDQAWGVAYQSGGQPRLIVSRSPVQVGQRQVLCGEWTGEKLRLYIDGNEVETRDLEYPMFPSRPGLYLGGVPEGILPAEQGPRFFDGTIYFVRISVLTGVAPERDWLSLKRSSEGTLYIFPPALGPEN